jgi:hypothetical protein
VLDVGEEGLGRGEGMRSALLNGDNVGSKRPLVKNLGIVYVTEPQHRGIIILRI